MYVYMFNVSLVMSPILSYLGIPCSFLVCVT